MIICLCLCLSICCMWTCLSVCASVCVSSSLPLSCSRLTFVLCRVDIFCPCRALSCPVLPCLVSFCLALPCLVLSYLLVFLCCVVSWLCCLGVVLSCLVLSCGCLVLWLSCLILWLSCCLVLSCLVLSLSCAVLSCQYLVVSCLVLSCVLSSLPRSKQKSPSGNRNRVKPWASSASVCCVWTHTALTLPNNVNFRCDPCDSKGWAQRKEEKDGGKGNHIGSPDGRVHFLGQGIVVECSWNSSSFRNFLGNRWHPLAFSLLRSPVFILSLFPSKLPPPPSRPPVKPEPWPQKMMRTEIWSTRTTPSISRNDRGI